MVQVWAAIPPTEHLKLPGLGSRDKSMEQEGARALGCLICCRWFCFVGGTVYSNAMVYVLVFECQGGDMPPHPCRSIVRVRGSLLVDIACIQFTI